MTLEGILTFVGIFIAVLAMARPIQRRSMEVFLPPRLTIGATVVSGVLLPIRDLPLGWNPFNLPIPLARELLNISSFVVLVIAAVLCWQSWHQAALTKENSAGVEHLFAAALREHQFDELERIIRKNKANLTHLSPQAIEILFSPRVIDALVASQSHLHLELLADMTLLTGLQEPFGPVDNTVRRLLREGATPLRAAIVKQYGGWEHHPCPPPEQELITKTFRNPTWYATAHAHYPLLMTAIDHVRTGTCDVLVQPEMERSSSPLVGIPPFGRGFSRHQGLSSDLGFFWAAQTSHRP